MLSISEASGIKTMSDDRKSLSDMAFPLQSRPDGAENHGMIGASAPMRALFAALPRIAASSSPLFICGERGTGKKLIARTVHALSARAAAPFETLDCGAMPEKRVRTALADSIQSADEGTLLLTGVGDLSVDLQARLLRVLRNQDIDVRVISTTDTDLEHAVESGRFREALYYQLNVLSLKVPPLRERGRDVQLLADFFLGRFTSPSSRRRVVGFSAEARSPLDLTVIPIAGEATTVPGQGPIRPDDTVAGDHDGHGIRSNRTTHGPGGLGAAQSSGNIPIGPSFAPGDLL